MRKLKNFKRHPAYLALVFFAAVVALDLGKSSITTGTAFAWMQQPPSIHKTVVRSSRYGASSSKTSAVSSSPVATFLSRRTLTSSSSTSSTQLRVSIGLGPLPPSDDDDAQGDGTTTTLVVDAPKVAGIDYEIPNHEEYRTSRRSKFDEQCDSWFESLLQAREVDSKEDGESNDDGVVLGCLKGDLSEQILHQLLTPVPLVNELELQDRSNPDWTPYVATKLPWMPLTPSYGLEQFGLPIPRRGAEAWRQFDVNGMVAQNYNTLMTVPETLNLEQIQQQLQSKGSWLNDDECDGRLVYVNGEFVEALSKTTPNAYNLHSCPSSDSDVYRYLSRLTDGFTDALLAVDNEALSEPSYQRLSGPNHKVGPPTSQFAINTQQGTACLAALNTIQVKHVGIVRSAATTTTTTMKPVLVVQAFTPCAGLSTSQTGAVGNVRILAIAESQSQLSLLQSQVDVDADVDVDASPESSASSSSSSSSHTAKLVNGYTQIIALEASNVTHAILDEIGGVVTPLVEMGDSDDYEPGEPHPREMEAARPQLQDTILNVVDAHVHRDASLHCTTVQMGGSGRHRLALSTSLLQSGATTQVNGFALSGGLQRCDIKTNIHHIAPSTVSKQFQKNLIGGRSTTSFRGRIRVEQDAQQTDSNQLSRSILLTDKARAWAVPSLEIIADDVKCSHGTTVSDLSEEELFYLTSRGIDRSTARQLLMYAFCSDVTSSIDTMWQSNVRSKVLDKLKTLVPQGPRAVQGEFQSI